MLAVGIVATMLLLVIVPLVSAGLVNQDELLYVLMVEAAREGRLVLQNGMELLPSERLVPIFVREGPSGLAPQYPAGYAFLALPFYLAAGVRGLMAMHALAFGATLAVLYALARRLDLPARTASHAVLIFALATFGLTYAFAIWPHASALLAVCASALAIVASTQDGQPRGRALALALAGGVIVGVGTNLRADTILLVPAVMLWLAARRALWPNASAYAAGLAPGLAAAAAVNAVKFGTWSPVSYGSTSGTTALATYWPLAAGMVAAGGIALALSSASVRRLGTIRVIGTLLACALVPALALEDSRALIFQLLEGVYVLVFNFQAYAPTAARISFDEGGNLLHHGALKRSLVESLPWLGLAPLLYLVFRNRPVPRGAGVLVLAIGIWISVFALRHWHGGSPPHMRYFLPILPFIAIFAALAIERVIHAARLRLPRDGAILAGTGLLAAILAFAVFAAVLMQDVDARTVAVRSSLALATGLALLSVLVVMSKGGLRKNAARLTLVAGIAAMMWAGTSALVYDFTWTQLLRNRSQDRNAVAETLPDRSLVITRAGAYFLPQFLRPDSFVATVVGPVAKRDWALIDFHLDAGRKVYVSDPKLADEIASVIGSEVYEFHAVENDRYDGIREVRRVTPILNSDGN